MVGCTPPNRSPEAQAVAGHVYRTVMAAVPDYRLHARQKALAICVQWPTNDEDPIYVDTGGSYALSNQSDGKFPPGQIVSGAMRSCQGAQAEGQFDCSCQILDVSGTNRLVVPAGVTDPTALIRSRPSKVEAQRPAARPGQAGQRRLRYARWQGSDDLSAAWLRAKRAEIRMMRTAVAALVLVLGSCAAPVGGDPDQRALGGRLLSAATAERPYYPEATGLKALALCLRWPSLPSEPVYLDAVADAIVGEDLSADVISAGVMQQCRRIRDRGRLDCDCQIADVSGRTLLQVPPALAADHPVATRTPEASRIAAEARARAELARPSGAPVRSLLTCRPPQCEVSEWTDQPARTPQPVRAASGAYGSRDGRNPTTCPRTTCEQNEMQE